jgi:hypothetical protein
MRHTQKVLQPQHQEGSGTNKTGGIVTESSNTGRVRTNMLDVGTFCSKRGRVSVILRDLKLAMS